MRRALKRQKQDQQSKQFEGSHKPSTSTLARLLAPPTAEISEQEDDEERQASGEPTFQPPPRESDVTRAPVLSEICNMRRRNLADKSNSALLVDALLRRRNPALDRIRAGLASKRAQRAREEHLQQGAEGLESANVASPPSWRRDANWDPAPWGPELGFDMASRRFHCTREGLLGHATPELEQVVAYLLREGADPNWSDEDNNSSLLLGCQYKNSARIVRMLLAKGARVNHKVMLDSCGCEAGDCALGSCSSQDRYCSYVDIALRLDQPAVVKLLVQHGGIPTASGHRFGFGEPTRAEQQRAIRDGTVVGWIDHLPPQSTLQSSLLLYARAHDFESLALQTMVNAMWAAVPRYDGDTINALVKHGISVNVRDNSGRTSLYLAVHQASMRTMTGNTAKESLPFVQTLLGTGADPNLVDHGGLPMAVFPLLRNTNEAVQLLRLLLDYGLNPELKFPYQICPSSPQSPASVLPHRETGEKDELWTLITFAKEFSIRSEMVQMLERSQTTASLSSTSSSSPSPLSSSSPLSSAWPLSLATLSAFKDPWADIDAAIEADMMGDPALSQMQWPQPFVGGRALPEATPSRRSEMSWSDDDG